MNEYLNNILNAETIDEVCAELQKALDSLKKGRYLEDLPDYYEDIAARNPNEIQEWHDEMHDWFDEMQNDEQSKREGHLKEISDLFDAALSKLRRLGFHRID